MLASYGGELAALATAVLWSATAVFFTYAGREVGSVVVNRARLLVALVFLVGTHWLLIGDPIPVGAEVERWGWLGVSGIVGLVGGDSFLFQAYLWVGPRLGMLMMSLAPVLAALLAFAFLGEQLLIAEWIAILITVSGIALVVMDRGRSAEPKKVNLHYGRGILFGVAAALGQAVGLVLAKQGLAGDFPALSGNVMRMSSAAVFLWSLTLLSGRAPSTLRALRGQRGALLPIIGGATTGPFIGVWLSLIAIQLTEVGIASTLMALSPIILLPVGRVVFKERIGWKAVAGTVVAVAGVGMLFLT
ncbi:MAG: DMT family transporter [Anaerolineales bacterium]|nr:DMT family transporter [Anaerolineales bacterium]